MTVSGPETEVVAAKVTPISSTAPAITFNVVTTETASTTRTTTTRTETTTQTTMTTVTTTEVATEPITEEVTEVISTLPVQEYERILLCNVVAREYGSDYVPETEKAKVVAVVMNRVNSPDFPNTIYDVLTQPNQFSGYVPYDTYTSQVTDSVIASVDYYFNHTSDFSSTILYFYGDGYMNYFS